MKIILLLILTLNLSLSTQCASYLFEFEKDGKKSRIFGSNHYLSLGRLPHAIKKTLLNHKILVGEVAENPADMLTQQTLKQLLRSRKTPNYFRLLSNTQKKQVRTQSKAVPFYNGNVDLNSLTPMGIFSFYHSGCCAHGMDCQMNKVFSTKGIVIGLEVFNFRTSHMSFGSLKELIDPPSRDSLINKVYLQGSIERFLTPSTLKDPIVKVRNENWLPKIVRLHQEYGEEAIFMVGVSHLFGEYGLLNLLQKQNFKIKRANKRGVFSVYRNLRA